MKTAKLTAIIVMASVLIFTGCGRSKKNPFEGKAEPNKILSDQKNGILNSELTPQEKAERMADLGESALETPKAALIAIDAFEESLRLDSQNSKANFYSALLRPTLLLKGFPGRLSKILTPEAVSEFVFDTLQEIKDGEVRSVVSQLLTGSGKIFSLPSEVQGFLAKELLPVLSDSQKRLEIVSRNRHFNTTLDYKNWGKARFWRARNHVVLDQVEVHSASMALKGIEVYAKFLSAYNLDDTLIIRDKYRHRQDVTTKEAIEIAKKYPKLFTLNEGADVLLKSILSDASDAVEGLKIIGNMLNGKNKREENLIPPFRHARDYADFVRGLMRASDVLAGPISIPLPIDQAEQEEVFVLISGTAFFANPTKDIKALLPTEFSEDGKYVKSKSFPDETFGGIVPEGDLISKTCQILKLYNNQKLGPDDKFGSWLDCSDRKDGK